MNDTTAQFFLYFCHLSFIIPCTILGYLFINKKIFYHACWLGLISSLLNNVLKVSFKVPLAAFLMSPGFAFPSGHMQLALVFYGWIFIHFSNWKIRILIPPLLLGIALGLIHFGYHTLEDVLGAVIVGSGFLIFYKIFIFEHIESAIPYIFVGLIATMIYIHLAFMIQPHTWVACAGLIYLIALEKRKSTLKKTL